MRTLRAVLGGGLAWACAVACVANASPTGDLPGDSPVVPSDDAGREGASDAPSDNAADRRDAPPPPPPPPPPFDASE